MGELRQRKSIRLRDFDYSTEGAYFVTMCTRNRECWFGEVVDGEMVLNQYGEIVRDEWLKSATIRQEIELDEFVIMPNHFHGIVFIGRSDQPVALHSKADFGDLHVREPYLKPGIDGTTGAGDRPVAPTVASTGPRRKSIGSLVGGFKASATKRINEIRQTPGVPVWQRNYFEHAIRNDADLDRIREYIQDNPRRWAEDDENPINRKMHDKQS